MTDGRWAVVWKLYSDLREASAGERAAALETSSVTPEVRDEVLALLDQSTVVSQTSPLPGMALGKAEPEYQPGAEFGRYVIIGLIGKGGFGRVYAAHDKDLRRSVAIKILAAPSSQDERLIEEARSASALNHPNILTIHETIPVDGSIAMVMEFVQGQSLRRELELAGGPLPFEQAIRFGTQIAQALDAAHSAGIAHRDVKPENILLRPDGYVKLVDFGLATIVAPPSPDDSLRFRGTLRYAAPEQLSGQVASPPSDVFSLGLVLYEMATGVHAFHGMTPLETADAISTRAATPPSRQNAALPESFDRLVLDMLSKDPARRPAAKQVAQALAVVPVRRASSKIAKIAVVSALAAIGALAAWRPWNRVEAPIEVRLKTTPLTGNEGKERRPAISSDGRFVVYEWQERLGQPEKTVVREIGTENMTVLPIPGPFHWLPGTHRIGYFKKTAEGDTVYTIDRTGGEPQEVFRAKKLIYIIWSPDLKYVVYIATTPDGLKDALYLYNTETKEHKQLTNPAPPGEQFAAISPDGRQIAVRRRTGIVNTDIFVSSFPQPGDWLQLSNLQTEGDSVTWLPNGKALVTSAFKGSNYSLWLLPLASPGQVMRLTDVGQEAFRVQAATAMNRLVWLHSLDDTNIWRVPAAGGTGERLVASLFRDSDVSVSSEGMLAFRSDRSGYPEIWVAGPNGESQKRVTTLEGFTGSPRWSADGRRLAFDSRKTTANADIWVADCGPNLQCQKPVRLTEHAETEALPNWSRDGKYLYFASRRSGDWQLWRMEALPGQSDKAVQLTTAGGYFGTESKDGKWLYYSRIDTPATTGIWRKPAASKAPFEDPGEFVFPMEYRSTATWNLCGDEIYFQTFFHQNLPVGAPSAIRAYDLRSKQTRLVMEGVSAPIGRGLSVSADCKSVYMSRTDRSESNVVYADYEFVR